MNPKAHAIVCGSSVVFITGYTLRPAIRTPQIATTATSTTAAHSHAGSPNCRSSNSVTYARLNAIASVSAACA